jgi:hypothetical protein
VIAADGVRTVTALANAAQTPVDLTRWHTFRVVARGNTMQHFLDGTPTATLIDTGPERARGGKIGIQIHSGEPTEVRVRSIRLKRLDR